MLFLTKENQHSDKEIITKRHVLELYTQNNRFRRDYRLRNTIQNEDKAKKINTTNESNIKSSMVEKKIEITLKIIFLGYILKAGTCCLVICVIVKSFNSTKITSFTKAKVILKIPFSIHLCWRGKNSTYNYVFKKSIKFHSTKIYQK